jgi:hypothetical protein
VRRVRVSALVGVVRDILPEVTGERLGGKYPKDADVAIGSGRWMAEDVLMLYTGYLGSRSGGLRPTFSIKHLAYTTQVIGNGRKFIDRLSQCSFLTYTLSTC